VNDAISCREAVGRLWEFIDNELDDATCEQVREHLERCRNCFPHYQFQQAYREFMATCKDGQCASPELRKKIFAALLGEGTVGS
jgi:anti-sigma factor (TIGR02949 family)